VTASWVGMVVERLEFLTFPVDASVAVGEVVYPSQGGAMPEVIDKVLVEQPFTIQPNEGQRFGPVDVRGAERANVMAKIERTEAKVQWLVEFHRGDITGRAATGNFGNDETAAASVPVFSPEVSMVVRNVANQPVAVQLLTVYAVR
jgi:hypothetical protein